MASFLCIPLFHYKMNPFLITDLRRPKGKDLIVFCGADYYKYNIRSWQTLVPVPDPPTVLLCMAYEPRATFTILNG